MGMAHSSDDVTCCAHVGSARHITSAAVCACTAACAHSRHGGSAQDTPCVRRTVACAPSGTAVVSTGGVAVAVGVGVRVVAVVVVMDVGFGGWAAAVLVASVSHGSIVSCVRQFCSPPPSHERCH